MNSLKMKQTIAATWLALTLLFGGTVLTAQFDLDSIPATYACAGLGHSSGGGCSASSN